ncbi:glycosyl/glycerophosphate transferase teichoic acid biosynthesis [Glutamicibacter uratoxydans]|uniref:Glycosyl/glycerophosphate transferase teichoic acid biosynthesis n=1 Tax=Glutamicibacter uratoxydans TaxID=43667 RepID=A0A4Y4DKE0_GLUUR|nr:CDP-glycerol glycerophosphotransferase family protein [Glutamicibacter uratoxydans]GED05772.1 glycosyl/glycerophosphate transferase teichoic acid biosynthesis [Glutamicibacter uratoxydans]
MYYKKVLGFKVSTAPEVQFSYGLSLYKCKKYADAVVHLEGAIARQPYRYGWIQTLALNMQRMKNYERALELFEAACQGEPDRINWRVRWAKCARQARRNDEALAILDQMLVDFPDSPEASGAIATFLKDHGQRWRELDIREAYQEQHESEPEWFYLAGEAARFMSRFEQAADFYRRAIELNDDVLKYHYALGQALESLGGAEQAEQAYAQAVAISNSELVHQTGIGRLHERNEQWAKALESYTRQLELGGDPAKRWNLNYRAGEVASRLFKLDEAAEFFAAAAKLGATAEERVKSSYARGRVLARAGRHRDAVAAYEAFVYELGEQQAIKPQVPYFRFGYSLQREGQFERAAKQYLLAADAWGYYAGKDKDSKWAGLRGNEHFQLGAAAEAAGDWREAAEQFAQALWHASSTERGWQARAGRAFAKLGEFETACRYFEHMLMFTEISVAGTGDALKGVGRRRGALAIHARDTQPMDEHLVLFESSHGNNVHCHPFAIYQAMRQDPRFAGFRYAWVYNDQSSIPQQLAEDADVAIVKQHSDKYISLLGTAKYLVNNATFPTYFLRREGQQVLNTWHGTPLKFMGKLVKDGVAEHRNVQRNFMATTHMMVPNEHTFKTLSVDHDLDGLFPGKVALTGSPRIDSTLNLSAQRRGEILELLGIDADSTQKIVLFAPTWRGQLKDRSYDVAGLVDDLAKLAEGGHHMLFRAHRFAEQLIGDADLDATIVPASIDTNELLAVVDVLITDYSSIFYDYLPMNRPVVFYTPDYEAYEAERGLYFDRATWPGNVYDEIDDAAAEVRRLTSGQGVEAHANFAQNAAEFSPMEDGAATGRVIEFFFFGDDSHLLEQPVEERTKLLFYQGGFKPNGIATAFTNLISALDPRKYLVSIAVDTNAVANNPDALQILESLPEHVRILPRAGATTMSAEERWVSDQFHAQRGHASPAAEQIHMGTMTREMHRSFGDVHFDAAIDFEGYSRFWAALFAAAHSHADRTLIYLHNDMVGEWLLRFGTMSGLFVTYPHFDQLVSVTESVGDLNREQLSERFGLDPAQFTVSENLLDLDKPLAWSKLGEPVHEFEGENLTVFANMARLSPEKGQAKLLEAFAEVHQRHPETRLLLIGDGPLHSDLDREIEARGLEEVVAITGLLANPFPTLKSADCFVFSSDYEGQGLAMVEALMLGLPAVSTDVVGSHSVLVGGYGLLVENSVQGLVDGMEQQLAGYQAPKKFDAAEYQASALAQFEQLLQLAKV